MNNLMVFGNHNVEVFEFNGQVLFNPYHVGECLAMKPDAVRYNMSKMNNKQVVKLTKSNVSLTHNLVIPTAGKNFLTESGVYKLIFKSRKKEAEKFADWVADEVLPTIRKTGKYEMKPQQLQIEEPYTLIKKTYQGKPIMVLKDIEYLTGESKHTIYWNVTHRNVNYDLLEGGRLISYKNENKLDVTYHSLIILYRENVIDLLSILNRNDLTDKINGYFGKEQPNIKKYQDAYTLQLLKSFNQIIFINKEFREKFDTIISEEYVKLGLMKMPCNDLSIHKAEGWNLLGNLQKFYMQYK